MCSPKWSADNCDAQINIDSYLYGIYSDEGNITIESSYIQIDCGDDKNEVAAIWGMGSNLDISGSTIDIESDGMYGIGGYYLTITNCKVNIVMKQDNT